MVMDFVSAIFPLIVPLFVVETTRSVYEYHLVIDERVAASPQNQDLSALLFLSREVLHQDLESHWRPALKEPKRLPTVLTKDEARHVFNHLSGPHDLMPNLLYGSGLRLMECCACG
jgi:integrase